MSAEDALASAVVAALRAAPALGALNAVHDGPAVKATPPYAELGEVLSVDWSVKGATGRELRVAVTIRDASDRATRVRALAAAAGQAIAALPSPVGDWDVASVALARARTASPAAGQWTATIDYRVRMLARI